MSEVEYIAPVFQGEVGKYRLNRVVWMEAVSSRINPCDLAEISLDCIGVHIGDFRKDDPVRIAMGYREKGLWPVFNGFVTDTSRKRTIQINAKDRMLLLAKRVTQTFVDATPQDIIGYGLRAAGVAPVRLSRATLPRRHYFVAKDITVIDLIKLVNRTWALDDWAFYFEPDGEFYWGPWTESRRFNQGTLTLLEYGKNIINLVPSDEETGMLETILLPHLCHSTVIAISDPRFWRRTVEARIERIRHRWEPQKARTVIEWRIKKS